MARGNNFDALRLLGALAVLVSHQFALMGLDQPMLGRFDVGDVALLMFFSISGYLVTASWLSDPDPVRYLKRRALRMAPGWAVLMVLSTLTMIAMGSRFFENNPVPNFNGSLWTLEWEVLCYVVIAVAAVFFPLRLATPVMLVSLLIIRPKLAVPDYAQIAAMFCAGAMLKVYPIRKFKIIPTAIYAGVVIALLMWEWYFYAFMLVVPVASVYIGLASWPYLRRAGRFGDFSYGIYIYAFPVQQIGVLWFGKDQPYLPMLAFSIVLTGVLAVLSWHFVEAPALRMKPGAKPQLLGKAAIGGVKEAV